MDANKLNLAKIFTGYTLYKVPFYQRSYVWEEDKWSRFLTDMYYVSANKKSYFLGSIILKQESTTTGTPDERIIIDGQQRFTTIILFFKSLVLKKPELAGAFINRFYIPLNEQVALQHSINDADAFEEVMKLEIDEPIIKKRPSKIIQAYNYFHENLDVNQVDFHTLISNLTMIGIDLNQEDDEQMIFDTINSLSEPLTTGELLKNYFFKEEAREEYEILWRPTFEEDSDTIEFWNRVITQGRLGRTNIDGFFNAMLQIKIHNHSIPGITADYRARIKRTDRLFRNYKELITDFELDKNDFIYELIEYAVLYKENFNQEVELIELPSLPCIERINFIIKYFDCSTLVPYILYVLKNVKDDTERSKIYDYLETYITRRIIAKSRNNDFSNLFAEHLIGANILTYQALREFIESKGRDQLLAMPSDEEIFEAVRENEQNNKRSLAILYLLETRLRSKDPHSTTVLPFEAYSLEHLMPKKWLKNWPLSAEYDESERDHYIKTIGNHTLLNSSLNSSISNSEWSTKLNGNSKGKGLKQYAQGLVTINPILQLKEWNEEEILNRADWLAQRINEVWISYIANKPSSNGGSGLSPRRPSLNFFEMGLKEGDELAFTEDQTKVAIVSGPKTVDFEGEAGLSLTALSQELSGSNTRQPCQWWIYNGKNLADIYDETYPSDSKSTVSASKKHVDQTDKTITLFPVVEKYFDQQILKIGRTTYRTYDNKIGFVFTETHARIRNNRMTYWFSLSKKQRKDISGFEEQYLIYALKDTHEVLKIPVSFIEKILLNLSVTNDASHTGRRHIKFLYSNDGQILLLLSKPYAREVNMNKYLLK